MSQVESILAEIRELVWDTVDALDVESIIEAGAGKQTISLAYEADGADRANLLKDRLMKELDHRIPNQFRPYRLLMQMSTSSPKPVLLKEWITLTSIAMDYCPSTKHWMNVPPRTDNTLGDTLRISLVVWLEQKRSLN